MINWFANLKVTFHRSALHGRERHTELTIFQVRHHHHQWRWLTPRVLFGRMMSYVRKASSTRVFPQERENDVGLLAWYKE